jgi:DNA-directed RNA polymerase alpha subunit
MRDNEKSTDLGLSTAERKELRGHGRRQRGRCSILRQSFPDDTPIESVRFFTRIRNAVTAVGWKTVGEIREASDATLLGLRDLGPGSVTSLHETLACRHAMVSDPWAKSRPDC